MNIEWFAFLILTLFDFITASIIFISALNKKMLTIPVWYKFGLIASAFGFAAQGGLNLPYLFYGIRIFANTLPFWVLKDLGIGTIACHFFWKEIRVNNRINTEKRRPVKKQPRKAPQRTVTKSTKTSTNRKADTTN